MTITTKSIKGSVFIGSVVVALVGFIISTTKGAIEVTSTLERVAETQSELRRVNAEQHERFNTRITDVEAWILRKEGYDAAIAEQRAADDD